MKRLFPISILEKLNVKKAAQAILILIFGLCFALPAPAWAADNASSLSADVQNKMLRILSSVEEEKEYYNLGNIDFGAVKIGAEIPVYKVANAALVNSDLHFWPILDNDKIVAHFFAANDFEGEIYVQLSGEFVEQINEYAENLPFAIIYDDNGAYIYVENEIHLLGMAEKLHSENEAANYISSVSARVLNSIDTASLLNNITLDVHAFCQEQSVAVAAKYSGFAILIKPVNNAILARPVAYLLLISSLLIY